MSTADTRRTLEQAIADFNAAFTDPERREAYLRLYDDAIVLHGYPPGVEGLDGARGFYGQIWDALPDGRLIGEDLIADGDRIATRFRLAGTHEGGPLLGVPAAGAAIDVTGMTVLRFGTSGRVVERWQVLDQLTLLTQLGVLTLA
jgi:predicted ester cyclase